MVLSVQRDCLLGNHCIARAPRPTTLQRREISANALSPEFSNPRGLAAMVPSRYKLSPIECRGARGMPFDSATLLHTRYGTEANTHPHD
jgi:hypothetical protein